MGALLGEVIGNYRVTELVGTGGMGVVYQAQHILLGKEVAIKVLQPERCQSREVVDRFFNEAKAASLIKDPGIVEIFDYGLLRDGNAYIVMELLEGETLGERIKRRGTLSPNHAVSIARHIAGTLSAAHAHGIIHRDLKPDNVFLVPDPAMARGERAKLLDFGIAKLNSTTQPSDMVKTETGRLMGTPYYMSPEQCRGAGRVDHRTDIYSLGCVMYQALTGRPPFVLEGAGEILAAHIHLAPQPLRAHDPDIPPPVEALVLKMLEKDPARRHQSMTEVMEALNRVVPQFVGEEEPEPSLLPSDRFPTTGGHRRITNPDELGAATTMTTTTLTTTSGEMRLDTERTSLVGARRTWPWVAAAVVALGIGAGVGVMVKRAADRTAAADETQAPGAAPSVAAAGGATSPLPPGPAAVAPTPAPAAQPVVRELGEEAKTDPTDEVTLVLTSEPEGAVVYREADGVRLGKTPLEVRVRRGEGEAAFLVRKSGYRQERVAIPAQEDGRRVIVLAQKPDRDKDKGGKRKSSSSAPGDEDDDEPDALAPAPTPTKAPRGKDDAISPFNDLNSRARSGGSKP